LVPKFHPKYILWNSIHSTTQ